MVPLDRKMLPNHDFFKRTLDRFTKTHLVLSDDNKTMTMLPSDFKDFDYWAQLLCRDGLTGRCYWEVEWRGGVNVLNCSELHYSVWHNDRGTHIPSSSSSSSGRVAVYVDYPAGTLSFYRVSSDTLIHLHTFNTTFTEPLYPGFAVGGLPGVITCPSVSLCSL
ncbi:neoverrucotoxin subunit beta-like [Sebastes fasciatus]|uniref:neoverrucotoxin subunit beta-like n=1 Tax=Sebastes fasciatus TaxID=394691 RepID=UPI003D9E79F6